MSVGGKGLLVVPLSALLFASGCTIGQLQKNTICQMQTVHNIQQQQVLDNLAMFAYNPSSFPFFSIATQGSSAVADTGTLSVPSTWQRAASGIFNFYQLAVNPSASRQITGNWTLNPINDSVKLSVMRCAYQRSVGGCLGITPSCVDPGCNALFEQFYPPPKPSLPLEGYSQCPQCQGGVRPATSPPRSPGLPHVPGIVRAMVTLI